MEIHFTPVGRQVQRVLEYPLRLENRSPVICFIDCIILRFLVSDLEPFYRVVFEILWNYRLLGVVRSESLL
jgi:hypothetical protein